MGYRLSIGLTGRKVWWGDDETIPDDHTHIGPAPDTVAALADEILAHDRAGREPPDELCQRMTAALDAALNAA